MQSNQEAVRTAAPIDQPDVNLTLEELLNELEREYAPLPVVDPDDLTRAVYAKRFGVSDKTAGYRLDALVKRGHLVRIDKRAPNGATVATYRAARDLA